MSTVLVRGSGSIGCLVAARLAGQHDVFLCTQWAEQRASIARDGIEVRHGGQASRHRVTVGLPEGARPDLIVIAVKSGQVAAVCTELAGLLASASAVVALQNGLGAVEKLAAVVAAEALVPAVTYQAATVSAPGAVKHATDGETVLGLTGRNARAAKRAAALLTDAGLPVRISREWEVERWRKLVAATAINALCALLDAPVGVLAIREELGRLCRKLAAETAAVAIAAGHDPQLPDIDSFIARRITASAANFPSILQDLRKGRPTEVAYINGMVAAVGSEVGMPTPLNSAMYALISSITADAEPLTADLPAADRSAAEFRKRGKHLL